MYRRLVIFGLSVVAVAVIALVTPLALAARDIVEIEEINEILNRAHSTANVWETEWSRNPSSDGLREIPIPEGDGNVTLVLPDGQTLGPPYPEQAGTAIEIARSGRSTTLRLDSGVIATAPAVLGDDTGVVVVSVDEISLSEDLAPRLAVLLVVSLILLAFAAVTAWLLARRTARPIRRLATTADRLAEGDLDARAEPSPIPEVRDVGTALNRLAIRVQELLEDERVGASELAHQLRTPLTALTIDIDAVEDPEVRARLQEDALALMTTTDEIITNARRPNREGLSARCDATSVVADRARFWAVLAEDQNRKMVVDLTESPVPVRLTADDLATIADILLQNVFNHTPEGTDFAVRLTEGVDNGAVLEVDDAGPGISDRTRHEPGSTGLGLSIAQRLARASGGSVAITRGTSGGTRVRVELGAPSA